MSPGKNNRPSKALTAATKSILKGQSLASTPAAAAASSGKKAAAPIVGGTKKSPPSSSNSTEPPLAPIFGTTKKRNKTSRGSPKRGERRPIGDISATPPRQSSQPAKSSATATSTKPPSVASKRTDAAESAQKPSSLTSTGDKQHRPSKTAKTGAGKEQSGEKVNFHTSDVTMSESVPDASTGKKSPVILTGGDKGTAGDPDEVEVCPMDTSDSTAKGPTSSDVSPATLEKSDTDKETEEICVRFGNNELHSYDNASAPNVSNITPEKEAGQDNDKPKSSPSISASQTENEFEVAEDEDVIFTVSNISPDDENAVRLALGCKPKSRHPDGLFVTIRIRLVTPENVHPSKHPAEYRSYVCSGISHILRALQSIDKSSAFLHVYSDHAGIAPAYDDPDKLLSWTDLSQTYGHISNQWIVHKSVSKSEKDKKSMSKLQRRKKRKADKRRAEKVGKSEKTRAMADNDVGHGGNYEEDHDGPGNMWLTLRLTTELAEDYVINSGRSELDHHLGIYIKGCQELHTQADYALIMIHKSLCLTAVEKVLIDALQVQEQTMFKYQGLNRRFVREEVDPLSGEVSLSQDPMPPLTLRWSMPPPLKRDKQGGKEHIISDEDRSLGSIVLLEASSDALDRLAPIIAQLRSNNAFQKLLGDKACFLDIGSRLPNLDNLSEWTTWVRRVQCHRGFNFMYDSIIIPGLHNPYINLKIKMADPSQRSTRRSTNLRRVLTRTSVPWNDPVDTLACQVCPILNSRNSAYGNTTIVFSGASAERQIIFANMAAHPIAWFYGFLTNECGYHHDMVIALLKRSFTDSDHDIIMADEDCDWDSESWTVSTATARTQNQDLERNLAENLHLDISELMKTRRAVDAGAERAELFRHKGMHPDADVPADRQPNDAYSRGTGVSYDASTVNSEQTNTFNDNRQKKYAAAKLKLAENTAEMATKDKKIEDQQKLIAKLLRQVGKHDENDILSNADSAESDSSSDEDDESSDDESSDDDSSDDESSDDDNSTSTSDKEDDSKGYSAASDSQMDLSAAEKDIPRHNPSATSTADDE